MSLSAFRDDLREAARRIRRNPRTSLLAAGTLALGIGAGAAVFTMANNVLLAPPPYRDPGRIVTVEGRRTARGRQGVSAPDFLDYRKEPELFEAAALTTYAEFSWTGQSLPGFDGAEVLRGLNVGADYFRVLDRPMAAGRGLLADEDQPGRDRVAVLSYSLWQRRFASRPDIAGQTLTLNGRIHTVVGVAGPRFLPYQRYDVAIWVPFRPSSSGRDSRQYACLARLSANTSVEQAQRRLDTLNLRLAAAYPAKNKDYNVKVEPLLREMREQARPAFLAMAGAVICLLLIASANVASLLLARATTQSREMAIRAALGAGRLRLYRMVLAESVMLALIAGVGGVLAGAWLLAGARALMPASLPYDWVFDLDTRFFIAALLLCAVTGLTAGVAPAFESFRLASGGLRPSAGRSRLLRHIVTAEIALAVLLSVGAGLLGKSFLGLLNRPLGYRTDQLLGMRVRLRGERYDTSGKRAAYWAELLERARSVPGIVMAATVSDLPMGMQYSGGEFEVSGMLPTRPEDLPRAHQIVASPGYFATLGIPLLAGRAFTEGDTAESEPVAIVNDLVAQTFWPGQDAIGKHVRAYDGRWRRIAGVVGRVRHGGPQDGSENQVYMPYGQTNQNTMFLVVRTHVPPESVVPAIRAQLAALDPNVPAFEVRTLGQAFEREIAMPRLPMALTASFAALAALLAALGLFGVMAYWVSRRTRELGIRSALGARPGELQALVLGQAGRLAGTGLVLGVAASLAVMRYLRSLLFGMSERDAPVYAAVVLLAAAAALVACWLPARRAARTDPATVLRDDG